MTIYERPGERILFKRKEFQAGYAAEVFDIPGKKWKMMSLANTGYKGILDPDIHTCAFEVGVDGRCLSRGRLVKREHGYELEKFVYKGCFAVLLRAVKKFVNRYGGDMDSVIEEALLRSPAPGCLFLR